MREDKIFNIQIRSVNDLLKHELFNDHYTNFEISLMCNEMKEKQISINELLK